MQLNNVLKSILLAAAFMMAWQAMPQPVARAQGRQPVTYRTEWIHTGWDGTKPVVQFQEKLNSIARGSEIVAVVPYGPNNEYVHIIFRDRP